MSTIVEDANKRANEAAESLKRAEEDLRNYQNGTLMLPAGVTYQDLKNEVTACRAVLTGAQRNYDSAVEHSKQQTMQLIAERDLLLQRSRTLATMFPLSAPSTHPSEHTLTMSERAARKQREMLKRN